MMIITTIVLAAGIVSFKDADKIKSWDAWDDHKAKSVVTEIHDKRECVTWKKLNKLDPGLKKIAAICDAHHIPFCAHNPSGPVANAVTLALGVSTPGYCIHETLFDDVPWRKEEIDEDVKFVDGMMYPSDRPGLGIELNEEAVAKFPKSDHWLRHYVGTLTNIRPQDSVRYYHG